MTAETSISCPPDWLTPKDAQSIYRWGKTRFWQLVADGAFPVTRPKAPTGRASRIVYVKRSDIDKFLATGYQTA